MPTHLSSPLYVGGVPVNTGLPYFGGNLRFIDYVNGANGNDGSAEAPWKTLEFALAHADIRDGRGDTIVILSGDDGTTYTQRLTAVVTWSEDNVHLVGLGANPGAWGRARVSELSGTNLGAYAMVTVSASNCVFDNVNFYNSSATAGAIATTVSGSRNVFRRCHFAGATNTTSAGSASTRSLKVTGSENLFEECTIGIDTVARSAAVKELELASACARNKFVGCDFVSYHSAAGGDGALFLTIGTGGIDRFVEFVRCRFINSIDSSGRAMTAGFSIAAAAGGLVLCHDCIMVGATDVHAGSPANLYWSHSDATTAAAGLAINPTAS
jgi:hypothetical protein